MDYKLPLPIGCLSIINVYEYIDGPKVFSCVSEFGKKYIVNWIDTSPTTDTWFYVPVSDQRLRGVESGEVSLRNVITNSERRNIFQVETPAKGTGQVKISKRKVSSIIEDELPDEDSFVELNANDGEHSSNTTLVSQPRGDVVAREAYYEEITKVVKKEEKAISKLPPKGDTREVALYSKRDVLDLSFNIKGTHKYEMDAATLGFALMYTQELVNYMPLQKKQSGRYKLGKDQSRKRKLKAVGLYAASFGIRLESEVESDLLGDTELSDTLQELMELIKSTDDMEKFKKCIRNLNVKATTVYYNLLKLLSEEGIELTAEWASPGSKHGVSRLDHSTISNAIQTIDEERQYDKKIVKIIGDLVGINVSRNKFNLITDMDEHIHGKISKALRNEQFTVPLRVEATVEVMIEANLLSGKEIISNTLLSIEAL